MKDSFAQSSASLRQALGRLFLGTSFTKEELRNLAIPTLQRSLPRERQKQEKTPSAFGHSPFAGGELHRSSPFFKEGWSRLRREVVISICVTKLNLPCILPCARQSPLQRGCPRLRRGGFAAMKIFLVILILAIPFSSFSQDFPGFFVDFH